jgi:hypothetical protein
MSGSAGDQLDQAIGLLSDAAQVLDGLAGQKPGTEAGKKGITPCLGLG